MSEAPELFVELIKKHGMPECATLTEMNGMWYEVPADVSANAEDAVGTAVFKPLPPESAAWLMAEHATRWASSFIDVSTLPAEPEARLKGVAKALRTR